MPSPELRIKYAEELQEKSDVSENSDVTFLYSQKHTVT